MTDATPNIFPTMRFADAQSALDWLSEAFGFHEHAVHRDEQGKIHHVGTFTKLEDQLCAFTSDFNRSAAGLMATSAGIIAVRG